MGNPSFVVKVVKIPLEYRRPLFLIFKEAVSNVARHSGATAVSVRLTLEGQALKLMVQDNGGGFDTSARLEGEGIGSVRKRVRDLGGSTSWKSDPGQGTCFEATLPLGNRGSPHEIGQVTARFRR